MKFESINELGILKADWMAKLPIGETVVDRVEIKPTDKCEICNTAFIRHCNPKTMEPDSENTHPFLPAKYAIGTKIQIAKRPLEKGEKEGDNMLCANCVHSKITHMTFYPNARDGTFEDHLICRHDIYCFDPIIYKITGGMWHKEWHKEQNDSVPSTEFAECMEEIMQEEAKLEGFGDVKSWLSWYPKHNIKIENTWRNQLERIQ